MNNVIVSVESTADLSEKVLKMSGISIINMEYSVDGEAHVMGDGAFTLSEFYDKMRGGSVTKTSQINEYEAKEYLKSILERGCDVIHLAFSGSLSGTYDNFVVAANELKTEYPDRKIAVVDSLCACAGQGLFAVSVADYLKTHGFDETVDYAEKLKRQIVHLFVVDDLKYLARGGRISKTTAILGNTFHLKPAMHMDKNGKLVPFKKVLSRKRSIDLIGNLTAQRFDGSIQKIFIAHADCYNDAKYLSSIVEKGTGVTPTIFDLGMVIGSHSGQVTLSIFFKGTSI